MYVGNTCQDFKLGGPVKHAGTNEMQYYSDSDHAGDTGVSLQSRAGCMILMNTMPVHWRSKKQPKAVISPAHAEIFVCIEPLRRATYLK